jgi:hypothetical protein
VLNLETGVHLHEVEFVSVSVKDELDSSCIGVINGLGSSNGSFTHLLPECRANVTGRLLNDLLMAALDTAVSLVHVDVVAMLVSENLKLDMSGVLHKLLHNHVVIAECSHGFSLGSLKRIREVSFGLNNAHSFATST